MLEDLFVCGFHSLDSISFRRTYLILSLCPHCFIHGVYVHYKHLLVYHGYIVLSAYYLV